MRAHHEHPSPFPPASYLFFLPSLSPPKEQCNRSEIWRGIMGRGGAWHCTAVCLAGTAPKWRKEQHEKGWPWPRTVQGRRQQLGSLTKPSSRLIFEIHSPPPPPTLTTSTHPPLFAALPSCAKLDCFPPFLSIFVCSMPNSLCLRAVA